MIKILGKIDLNQFNQEKRKNPENYLMKLREKLKDLSEDVNEEFSDFLNEDGSIKLVGDEVESDKVLIQEQEKAFAGSEDVEIWKKKREKKDSSVAEMALTIAFHELLKKDFLVARASTYDDYNNGVDQVIIDKKTGAIICGFDEVIRYEGDGDKQKKEVKIRNKMEHGGAKIKYGATIEEGKLIRKELKNIPTFYISINKKDLDKLLQTIKNDKIEEQSEKLLGELVTSLEEQYSDISSLSLYPKLVKNLQVFQESLEKIKNCL